MGIPFDMTCNRQMEVLLRLKTVAIQRCRERVVAAKQTPRDTTKPTASTPGNPVIAHRLKQLYGL